MRREIITQFKKAIRQLAARFVASRVTVPILAGPAKGLRVPRDIAIAYPSLILGNYEPAVTNAILSIKQPINVAYDVGAHIGLTALILAKGFGKNTSVIAFEPSRENISSLASLLSANPEIEVRAIPLALSDCVGEAEFYRFQGSSMGLLGAIAAKDSTKVRESDAEIVRTTTLDEFVFDEGHPAPEFIKIDVEGAESLVLTGGLQTISRYQPVLLIELHGPVHAASVYDLLCGTSYRWTYIRPGIGPSESILDRSQLLAYFGPRDRWTQHVLLQ